MRPRQLGNSPVWVPALGMGTWPLGGRWTFHGRPAGWTTVGEEDAVAALRTGLDLGLSLIDTADAYGCGAAERYVGQAMAGRRHEVVVATKVGLLFDEDSRTGGGTSIAPAYLRSAVAASLRRLNTDWVDVIQLHGGADTAQQADDVVAVFEDLVQEGTARAHGTSVTTPAVMARFAAAPHAVTVEHTFNVLERDTAAAEMVRSSKLTSLARSPLAMGLLSGRYSEDRLPEEGDVRRHTPHWTYFHRSHMAAWLDTIHQLRDLLTTGGRSLAQGALAYLWAEDPTVVAIPGFRSPRQIAELAAALRLGPLPADVVAAVNTIRESARHRQPEGR